MSSPALISVLLACSAAAVATVLGWVLAAIASRFLLRACLAASSRACLLAQARLLPLAAVMILVPAQIQAFRTYEVGGRETAGVLLLLLGASGLLLCLNGMRRAASAFAGMIDV